jgi:Taurine catabolism dioxygenase TauD, TfdA family
MGSIRTTPITGAKAWRGAELAGDPAWTITWNAAELAEIDRALGAARATGRALADLDREQFPLPTVASRLATVLDEIYAGRGFVLLRGLPVDRYSAEDVGLILWGLGRYLGAPLYQNPQGHLLGHVYNHGRAYGDIDVRGYETNAYLAYHTDAGDMVGLLCLRRGLHAAHQHRRLAHAWRLGPGR